MLLVLVEDVLLDVVVDVLLLVLDVLVEEVLVVVLRCEVVM